MKKQIKTYCCSLKDSAEAEWIDAKSAAEAASEYAEIVDAEHDDIICVFEKHEKYRVKSLTRSVVKV